MIPLSVKVKTGRYAETRTFRVEIVREPNLLPTRVQTVLTSAVDTEGNLPEEMTAQVPPCRFGDRLTEPTYAWVTSTVPNGTCRLRLVATDRPSNPPGKAQPRERITDPFLIRPHHPTIDLNANN